MKTICSLAAVHVALLCQAGAEVPSTNNAVPLPDDASTDSWAFSAYVYGYLVPESRDYVNPTFTADHGWLHLEARYNYEALETGSLWVGYNFSAGKELVFEIAPMLGGVFGELTGIAEPAQRADGTS